MNKKGILKELKVCTRIKNLRLPNDMDFEIHDGVLTITLSPKGVTGNMQNDSSAFEGWTLCLKARLPELIRQVHIAWNAEISGNDLHYMRFLYRLRKFIKTFDWATTNSYNFDNFNTDGWVVNFPKNESQKNAKNEEAQLERKYVEEHRKNYDAMCHQLPVGVFEDKVANEKAIMPHRHSQLDIWAIKGDELFVFELKKEGNTKIGIISELMFYCNIMDDLRNHRIKYPDDARTYDFRDFDKLYRAYQERSIKTINGVFLTGKLHPLITPKVLSLMNSSGMVKYSHQIV